MDFPFLNRLIDHNHWGNAIVLETCREMSQAQFTQVFEIGPGSLHNIMNHTIGAMERWAERISDHLDRVVPDDTHRVFTPDDLLQRNDAATSALRDVGLRVAREDRVDEPMKFESSASDTVYEFTRGTALVHVLTHGAHHRAQACNIFRHLGVDGPDVDAIEWELVTK